MGSLWTESLCRTKANTFMVDNSTHISGALICSYLRDAVPLSSVVPLGGLPGIDKSSDNRGLFSGLI